MEKFSTSSHQSKPLLILSLMVSLFLHVGGFYLLLKHPPSFLVAREVPIHEMATMEEIDYEMDIAASEAFQNLILREDPKVYASVDEPSHLMIAPYAPPLIKNPMESPKISPFSEKKWINFSRKIVKEGLNELFPPPFYRSKQSRLQRHRSRFPSRFLFRATGNLSCFIYCNSPFLPLCLSDQRNAPNFFR